MVGGMTCVHVFGLGSPMLAFLSPGASMLLSLVLAHPGGQEGGSVTWLGESSFKLVNPLCFKRGTRPIVSGN